ncbi:LysR substrate-binding domain-containing protein [uncultured Bacteroides sp.]|uniref:LysR substrate-binding domain-containing protein n=1 Tax=uncultured Bacteroides sp. TaxID=162156 RepID=UPI002AAA7E36|nr:LysR substrate-binding domain-containing protein [uncultured Bacteroides sp.]
MEIRQLKYFIKSAELLNFTEAAKASSIAESTLSQQIKQLETELNILLFKRVKKHIELTEAGEMLLPYARRTVADSEDAAQRMNDLQNLHTGTLRIGGTFSLCSLLTDTLLKFSQKYPNIKVTVECQTANKLLKHLKEHKLDLALCFESPLSIESIESEYLFDSPLCVILHRHHSLAAMKEIPLQMLRNYPLALTTKEMHARAILDNYLVMNKQKLEPQMELNDINILFQLIKTKHWTSLLPMSTIINEKELKAVPLAEKELKMQAALMWLKDNYQKKAVTEFTQMLLKKLKG